MSHTFNTRNICLVLNCNCEMKKCTLIKDTFELTLLGVNSVCVAGVGVRSESYFTVRGVPLVQHTTVWLSVYVRYVIVFSMRKHIWITKPGRHLLPHPAAVVPYETTRGRQRSDPTSGGFPLCLCSCTADCLRPWLGCWTGLWRMNPRGKHPSTFTTIKNSVWSLWGNAKVVCIVLVTMCLLGCDWQRNVRVRLSQWDLKFSAYTVWREGRGVPWS